MGWVFVIVMGIIIGILGKFVAPGDRDNVPIWVTVLCGIVGVVIGYGWLGGTRGIDWLAFFVSIIIAAILVMAAATLMGRVRKT
ncbi:MAG: GlsB/YeaQ/YmgE family stress response membrane protein [Nocardioides sp.]|nr:GlsB/YeaQ/YmgE family stress response membrane protein [Nocardioides sp.]